MENTKTKKLPDTVFNESGVCVDQYIEDRKTFYFDCKKKAEAFAAQIRSYFYPVKVYTGRGIFQSYGYCVPK